MQDINDLSMEEFAKTHNLVGNLLNHEESKQYETLDFPANVSILNTALKNKLKFDPNYEVFVALKYFPYFTSQKVGVELPRKTAYAYISNKGNVYHIRRKTIAKKGNINTSGYMRSRYRVGDGIVQFNINRAVATCFVPVPDNLKATGVQNLHSNHIDTNKLNNDFTNLEWMTHQQNAQHGVDNNLRVYLNGIHHYATKPLLATVIIPGDFEGHKFLKAGKDEIDTLLGDKTNSNACFKCARGEAAYAKGCTWKFATTEEIEEFIDYVVPDELQELIRNYNSHWKAPIIATRVSDGHLILIEGGPKEITELGFTHQTVYTICSGKKMDHKGYSFRRADGEDEVKAIKELISKQTTKHVVVETPKQAVILGTRVSDGFMRFFNGAKDIKAAGWVGSTVYRATSKPGKIVNGWTFVRLETDEEVNKYKELIAKQTIVE